MARVAEILGVAHEIGGRLADIPSPSLAPALADIRAQLAGLVFPGFVTALGSDRLPHLLRYLRAIVRRLDKLPTEPARDAERMERSSSCNRRTRSSPPEPATPRPAEVEQVRWMIEELRVSYFAQMLGTPAPISDKRIWKAVDQLES